jgi:prepilin-type N-terminal cleavage/methylation domain-containing protein
MPKQFGYTFIELLVVVALIGILGSVTVFKSPGIVNSRSVLIEADALASKVSYLITKARGSQSTIQLSCSNQTIVAGIYTGVRSNSLNASVSNVVGLDAKLQTAALSHQDQTLFDGGVKTSVQCPSTCGDLYITSDGYLLSSQGCSAIDFIFTKNSSPDTLSRLSLSNLGYPRVYMKSTAISNSWNELIR